jgi:hypothetical protein
MPDVKRSIKFQKEQQEIYDKLLAILNYNGDFTFTLFDVDYNKDLQEQIMELKPDVAKYFSVKSTRWMQPECVRPYMGIIRHVLGQFGKYLISGTGSGIMPDGSVRRTTKFTIM